MTAEEFRRYGRAVVDRIAEIGVPLQSQLPGVDPGADRLTRRVGPPL